MTTTSTEKHAELVDAGWSVRLDGLWRHPDRKDRRAFTLAAAWLEHAEAAKERPAPVVAVTAHTRARGDTR